MLKGGMNTVKSSDLLQSGEYPYLQNVRAYLQDRIVGRNTQSAPIITIDSSVQSLARMNDTTPAGPASGFVLISTDTGGGVYAGASKVASGLSGTPDSIIPFRPNASVQPWAYIADSSHGAVLDTKYALDDSSAIFDCFGQIKVRSDGLVHKTGIQEPPLAPTVSTGNTSVTTSGGLEAKAIPWTNYAGQNPNYDYGESDGEPDPTPDGTAPFIVDCANASTITIATLTGTADINGDASATPTTLGPSTAVSTNPGHYIQIAGTGMTPATATVVVGAFTDGNGNVVAAGVAPLFVPSVVDVGAVIGVANAIQVPYGAQAFQIGINSTGDTFSSNSGSFSISAEVTTDALPPYTGVLGQLSLYYWGDSPTSGGVASYLWKNPGDAGGGIPRSTSNAVGTTTGNSFIFDATFTAGLPGLPGTGTENVPMQWYSLSPESAVIGSAPVFPSPITVTYPSNTDYSNFNFCLYGKIYIPEAGQYTFVLTNHDDCIWGIQDATLISATPSGSGEGGSVGLSSSGQTITVAQGYPLLPRQNYTSGEGGDYAQTTVVVSFAAAGIYGIEIDFDYWFHSGRILLLEGSPTPSASPTIIPPLTQAVRTNVSYAGKYRSSLTGAQSNPSPTTTAQTTPVLASTVSLPYSPDPQVDKCDFYRQDVGLPNYTYVATGPNTDPPTAITDALTDLEAANNQQLTYDDFEPVPSIDLPQTGVVDVSGGVVTWVSGDQFNTRWLPGTVMLIGYPTQLAYNFVSRPTSATEVVIPGVPDGTSLIYNIAEPILANQPLPSMWGPTDNTSYMFACNDPMRPGTLYFSKGNAPDSWPDTNQIEVTSPSEPLMNGYIIGGIGQVFSTERAWWIYPTFTTALATVSGVSGQPFNLIESVNDRGLYIRTCICTEAGKNGFFRAKDGIYISPSGQGSRPISDPIYNLFPHEEASGTSVPGPAKIGSYTVYPPDDTKPNAQKLSFAYGYLYYDYQDVNGDPRTLVYDAAAKGWSVDVGTPAFTVHAPIVGQGANGTYTGCVDGSVRMLSGEASEAATSVVATLSDNAGDDRAFKRLGDVFVKAVIQNSSPVAVVLYANQYGIALDGYAPTTLTGTGLLAPYIVSDSSGHGIDLIDAEMILSWPTDSGNAIELWQPDFVPLPAATEDQPSDWGDLGSPGTNYVRGLILEADTFNVAKSIAIEDELGALHAPQESPITLNGQQKIGLSFNPPFVSHIGRIVSSDGVLWRRGPEQGWTLQWLSDPYPELTRERTPIMEIHGPDNKFVQGVKLIADTANEPVTFQVQYDGGQTGPSFTGAFNGKQTLVFAWTPFVAHDIQLVPQSAARVWWGGTGQGQSEWVFEPFPESASLWQTEADRPWRRRLAAHRLSQLRVHLNRSGHAPIPC